MLRRAILLLMILTICLHACSCISHRYTTCIVEITPTTTGFERQLTMYRTEVSDSSRTRTGPRVEPEVADRLERIYGARPDTTAPYVGRGQFKSIPDDLNNWGSLRSFPSALGGCWMYAERVGGELDPAAKLVRRFAAADSLTDTMLGWSEAELGSHPNWPALRSELDVDLRRMLRNLVLDSVHDDSASFDRFMVSFFEQPLSFMAIAARPPSEEDMDAILVRWILQELRARMAKTLGLQGPAEINRVLHYISHPDSARLSFERYRASTTGAPADSASWTSTMSLLMGDIDLFGWGHDEDSLAVRLVLPPGIHLDSNAPSDSGLASPAWSGWVEGLPNPSTGLPFVFWATWSQPDSAAQHHLFGDIEVDEDDLTNYCLWFNTLDAKQQAEWDKMLRRLRPGRLKRLERFRFSDAKRGEEQEIPGRDLLLKVLD